MYIIYILNIQYLINLDSKIRLSTLELAIDLLLVLTKGDDADTDGCRLTDGHLACIEGAKESSNLVLRTFYKVWEKVTIAIN